MALSDAPNDSGVDHLTLWLLDAMGRGASSSSAHRVHKGGSEMSEKIYERKHEEQLTLHREG